MNYILDTNAWLEYLVESKKGKVVNDLFERKNAVFFTLESTVSEILLWCLREKQKFNEVFALVRNKSLVEPIDLNKWVEAARTRTEMRKTLKDFGLMDSLLIAMQKETGGIIVSGDPHFKSLKNALFLND